MIKKIFFLFLFSCFSLPFFSFAQNDVNAYLFYGEGCPHCAKEKQFLDVLEKEYPNLKIYQYEVYNNSENVFLFDKVAKSLGARADGVPFLVIGDDYFVGFSESITTKVVRKKVMECSTSPCSDSVLQIVGLKKVETEETKKIEESIPEEFATTSSDTLSKIGEIDLPILGNTDLSKFSLPAITVILGVLDGFNPCAMWALLFLISLLLGMKDRKRMWILGSAFIVASALVYFLFMSAWLNIILLLGFVFWIRVVIGFVALFGGGYNLKEFFTNKEAVCKVGGEENKMKVFEKMKNAVGQKSFILALVGIVFLAFAINLVELVCSAGLPAVYAQILALNQISTLEYYLYISLYILFFMIDDLFVFFVAMTTLKITGATAKYTIMSRLIGGIIMLAIGLAIIFKPEILMFG